MTNSHGTAGRIAREMAQHRFRKQAIYAALLFLIAILIFSNLHKVVKFGLPAVIILAVVVIQVADHLEKKGLHQKKRAKDADRGARAEEVVAERLMDLPDGYHTFHDLAFDGFNIDHVVVGPGGIFLVATKSPAGRVDAKGEVLLLNGAPFIKNILNQTWTQTDQLRDFLKLRTSREWTVKPVLCFSRASVSISKPVKGITVVNKRYLTTYFTNQKQSLNSEDIETITRILQEKTRCGGVE